MWTHVVMASIHRCLHGQVLNATAICLTFAVFLFGLVVSQAEILKNWKLQDGETRYGNRNSYRSCDEDVTFRIRMNILTFM